MTNQSDNLRERLLKELDPDFTTYLPDQGMPDTIWKLNDAQIDYIINQVTEELEIQHQKELMECIEDTRQRVCEVVENEVKNTIDKYNHDAECVFALNDVLSALTHVQEALTKQT